MPSANFNHLQISDNDDEDVDRLRTFSSSGKGGKVRIPCEFDAAVFILNSVLFMCPRAFMMFIVQFH